MISKKPELLAPAGDWRMLTTVVKAGADAVYFGIDKLNMRAAAKNFTLEELPDIVKFSAIITLMRTVCKCSVILLFRHRFIEGEIINPN